MGWKSWPYWVRGGLTLVIFWLITGIIEIIIWGVPIHLFNSKFLNTLNIIPGSLKALIFGIVLAFSTAHPFIATIASIFLILLVTLIYFSIGAFIGWIYGKIFGKVVK